MDVRIASLTLRFAAPLQTANGELRERELLLLRLRGEDGVVGWGEAAPLEPYDGVPLDAVREALAAYEPILRGGDGLGGGELLDACRAVADLPAGAGRRRPRAVGPRRQPRAAAGQRAHHRRPGERGARQRRRSPPRIARARRPRPSAPRARATRA